MAYAVGEDGEVPPGVGAAAAVTMAAPQLAQNCAFGASGDPHREQKYVATVSSGPPDRARAT